MKQNPLSRCFECKYFRGARQGKCEAFPDQIPSEIWSGNIEHNKPFPGDRGISFQPKDTSEFLAVTELAELLGVNMKTVYRALWSNKIPAYKVGRIWRVAKKDLESIKK
jgi:excisionase family DNA binding protein